MQDSELNEFSAILAGLGELYERKLSKVLVEIYWNALKEYSLDDIKKAVNNIVKTNKYPTLPKPAEFIEYICPPQDAEMKTELMTEEFWKRFDGSGWASFTWDEPVLAMAVEHYGGWRMILDTFPRDSKRDVKFWMKDFKKVCQMFLAHPVKRVNMKYVGLHEEDNRAKGYLTDNLGSPIQLPGDKGFIEFIMLDSPEAVKYLEDHSEGQKLLVVSENNVRQNGIQQKRRKDEKRN